jgi:hypothetical protein
MRGDSFKLGLRLVGESIIIATPSHTRETVEGIWRWDTLK